LLQSVPIGFNGAGQQFRNDVRFEDFTAVIMKNAFFWDIKTQFLPHRKNLASPL
jgi:hypothetical protein